jgi:hypothetical protein
VAPWQDYALDVMLSLKESGEWLYREVAIIAARQNGKTSVLIPRVMMGLEAGERILHAAHVREISREVFLRLSPILPPGYKMRLANGQETIRSPQGGEYRVVAAQRGARGLSADLLIIDELREFEDFDFIAAAEPTLTESVNPQVIYVSNAGTDKSLVLNDLRLRAGNDPNLAYMEWSADPHLAIDDRDGWLQANPLIGYGNNSLERMQTLYEKYQAANELSHFETEHLCRWVVSMFPRLLQDPDWQKARRPVENPTKPHMGINVDPSGTRVSVAYAWSQSDGSIGLTVRDFTGSPVDLTALAVDLQDVNRQLHAGAVGFDPWTDQHLARHFPSARAINGSEFANASERFVRAVESGMLRWEQAEPVSNDLPYTARKPTTGTAFIAQRADEHRSISGVLAAIRAVWIASAPKGESVIY